MMSKEKLKNKIKEELSVPRKAIEGDENKEIEKYLGLFLVEKGYIEEIETRDEDWGFVYHSVTRSIAISEKEMPHTKWEKCIFKMGINKKTEENLFPNPGVETKRYRFLHEASHGYQEYLCHKESPEDAKLWHGKSLEGEINSFYSKIFNFCFHKRAEENDNKGEKKEKERGLSIWGNVSKYSVESGEILNKNSEIAVRAQEDANELITMFLWHPEYLDNYLDYLSLNYENHQVRERESTREDLEKRGLLQISKEDAGYLREVIASYVGEMKNEIKCVIMQNTSGDKKEGLF